MYAYKANMLLCARNDCMAEMAEDGSIKWYTMSHSQGKSK